MDGLLVSDFNIENLASLLRNDRDEPTLTCRVAPYGQAAQVLLDHDASVWKPQPDFVLAWTRPEAVLPGFNQALCGMGIDTPSVLAQVDDHCDRLVQAKGRARLLFVPTWSVSTMHPGQGLLDLT